MTHEEIIPLLPWYLNGTLTDMEQQAVEQHLPSCAICRQEIASLKPIQQGVVAQNEATLIPSPNLFAHILEKIKESEPTPVTFTVRLKEYWGSLWQPVPSFAYAVMAAQFILILSLVAVHYNQPTELTTLSGDTSQPISKVKLDVAFHPDATVLKIRNLLQTVEGSIVGGPSALGLYTVSLPLSANQTSEIDKRIVLLRQDTSIIQFVGLK